MEKINNNKAGLAMGIVFGLIHLFWIILVGVGAAKFLMDKILAMHCLEISYAITSLSLKRAIGLLVFTFVAGYVIGWVLSVFYNWLNKK